MIITLNEESNIERCIRSVPWASDVVVVDSGSQDRTAEIAKSLGARVFVESWRGYRDQKNRAAELAQYDWILSLDADEALSPESAVEVAELLKGPLIQNNQVDGLEFPRLSFHMQRWIHHGGWYPDWQLRFFHRQRARWGEGHVHERVHAARKQRVRHPILHWPFQDLAEQVRTNNNYSTLGARDLFDRGRRYSIIRLLLKPSSKFFETYFVKRGFQDGWPGFVIAVGAAYSVFLKFAKLRELELQSGHKSITKNTKACPQLD